PTSTRLSAATWRRPTPLKSTCASATNRQWQRVARSRQRRARRTASALACWRARKPRRRRVVKLVRDENFNGDILRGLFRRRPELDVVRVQDVGLNATSDPHILEWAASQDRILLTHDRDTMPSFAYDRVSRGESMPGVFLVSDQMPIGQAIDEILLAVDC